MGGSGHMGSKNQSTQNGKISKSIQTLKQCSKTTAENSVKHEKNF